MLKNDYSQSLYERPNEALGEFADEIKNDLRAEYLAQQGQEQFWRGFYELNPTLRANREIVAAVLNENLETLGDMPAEEAAGELARLVRERLEYLKRTERQREEAAAFVGGPGLEGKPASEQPVNIPPTMGSFIKKRREARYDAQRRRANTA
jgi:hypothetical protein